MEGGWSKTDSGVPLPVQVARFRDAPGQGLTSFVTLGLSNHEVMLSGGRPARAELILSCWNRDRDLGVPALLSVVAGDLIKSAKLPSRGGILGPAGQLFAGSRLSALYFSVPIFFPAEFGAWKGSAPPTILIQLIPITEDEAALVRERGWNEFEDHLERRDPDLFDLRRESSLI
ncbi:suppressor of fused domain protein [Micromonospora sp. WMMA1363]